MAEPTTVAVFARTPELGRVKTRLAAEIGSEEALRAHVALLEGTLTAINPRRGYDTELWLTGTAADPQFALPVRYQGIGDLGERMLDAIQQITATDRLAIVIGCDCPEMSSDYLIQARDALHDHDVVIGPSEDGGYVLIGMRAAQPRLFLDMTWSVDSVFDETLARARALRLTVAVLERLWDVDTLADWRRWRSL